MPISPHSRLLCFSLLGTLSAAACGGGAAPAPQGGGGRGGGRGGGPGVPVEIVTLALSAVENVTEYVGTVKSRRSTTVQPQVEGFLTRIAVTSGAAVTPGTVLFEIDSASQEASVAALESTQAARDADATYARQQAARVKALFDAGAASQQELDQSATAVMTAEAQLKAVAAQIRQQRNELAYYKVTASTSGVVGDIPVRQGDRVTRSTLLTTIDDNKNLEAYLNVPVKDATRLRPGLTVKLMGDGGEVLATERLYFVASTVDATQTVLAKATISAGAASKFRSDQFIRAHLVWSEEQRLLAPLAAVTRVGGQFFVFVAEAGEGGGLVARMRPVTLGAVVGNAYVVNDGLKEGERLITGGVQKIGDGAPVTAMPAGGGAGRQGGEGR